jgi:hypothetical protein
VEEVTEAVTEREELFPMEAGDEMPVNTVGDVIMKLDRAKYFEQKADALQVEMAATIAQFTEWYQTRIARAEEREQYHLTQIRNYMDNNGLDKVPTPRGTAYFRNTEKIHWPADDQELLTWAECDPAQFVKTRTVVTPDKKAIGEFIKTTGELPPGVTVEPVRTFCIKAPAGHRNV